MDYQTLHSRDITNFTSSSPRTVPPAHPPLPRTPLTITPDRMPTVSAAQALEDLQSSSTRSITTGLKGLDLALLGGNGERDGRGGGVERGQVTEVYGPPGVGKTALGMQLAAGVLAKGEGVVWVDAASPLPGPRLLQILSSLPAPPVNDPASSTPNLQRATDLLPNLTIFSTPTLPHLIALLCHNAPAFPPPSTSLIVIDALSSLTTTTYPRNIEASKPDSRHWAASRKWPVLQHLIASLQKLATLRNIAVVVLNQSVTKMQPGGGAALVSAVASAAWDAGIAARVVVFRDWGWEAGEVRFAQVERGGNEGVVGFVVCDEGLREVMLPDAAESGEGDVIARGPVNTKKRKASEIRDSDEEGGLEDDDEDYGWAEEDEGHLPDPPSQWLGSEDILVPGPAEEEEEEEEEVEEAEEIEENEDGEED